MITKKYELLKNDTVNIGDKILYRIKALINFSDVRAGDLGGYIENKDNLSNTGNAWVYDNARVYGNAWVYDNAMVYGDAWVYGTAWVYGNARVYGDAWVYDNARVSGNARVSDNARVSGNAWVYGDARVSDNARVSGNAWVYGDARVSDNALISSNNDYILFYGFGSANRITTIFKCSDNSIKVNCGCFYGTLSEFADKVILTHSDNKYAKEYNAIIDLAKMHFEL